MVLSSEEEANLIAALVAGRRTAQATITPDPLTVRRAAYARTQLIESHLPLVGKVARQYRFRGVDYEDLIQDGCVGLVRAIDRLEVAPKARITTYAWPWIEQEIRRAIDRVGGPVSLPQRAARAAARMRGYARDYTDSLEVLLNSDVLARDTSLPFGLVTALLQIEMPCVSLDAPLPDGRALRDLLCDAAAPSVVDLVDDGLSQVDRDLTTVMLLRALTARDRVLIVWYFGLLECQPSSLQTISAMAQDPNDGLFLVSKVIERLTAGRWSQRAFEDIVQLKLLDCEELRQELAVSPATLRTYLPNAFGAMADYVRITQLPVEVLQRLHPSSSVPSTRAVA